MLLIPVCPSVRSQSRHARRQGASLVAGHLTDLCCLAWAQAKKVLLLLTVNALAALLLTYWSIYSDSICESALAGSSCQFSHDLHERHVIAGLVVCSTLLWIDCLTLITCLLGFWVEQKKPNKIFTFGHIRCEILFVFVVTITALLSSLLTLKECLVRVSHQPVVET